MTIGIGDSYAEVTFEAPYVELTSLFQREAQRGGVEEGEKVSINN